MSLSTFTLPDTSNVCCGILLPIPTLFELVSALNVDPPTPTSNLCVAVKNPTIKLSMGFVIVTSPLKVALPSTSMSPNFSFVLLSKS